MIVFKVDFGFSFRFGLIKGDLVWDENDIVWWIRYCVFKIYFYLIFSFWENEFFLVGKIFKVNILSKVLVFRNEYVDLYGGGGREGIRGNLDIFGIG